jgi:hypothetical protein
MRAREGQESHRFQGLDRLARINSHIELHPGALRPPARRTAAHPTARQNAGGERFLEVTRR